MKSLVLVPYTFVLMNWAAVVGLHHFVSGKRNEWSGEAAEVSHKESRAHDFADGFDPKLPDVF